MSRQRQRITRCRCLRYAEPELVLGATVKVCTEVDPIIGRATFLTERHDLPCISQTAGHGRLEQLLPYHSITDDDQRFCHYLTV